jgi:hypothetical protein
VTARTKIWILASVVAVALVGGSIALFMANADPGPSSCEMPKPVVVHAREPIADSSELGRSIAPGSSAISSKTPAVQTPRSESKPSRLGSGSESVHDTAQVEVLSASPTTASDTANNNEAEEEALKSQVASEQARDEVLKLMAQAQAQPSQPADAGH